MNEYKQKVLEVYPAASLRWGYVRKFYLDRGKDLVCGIWPTWRDENCLAYIHDMDPYNPDVLWKRAWEYVQEQVVDGLTS
jgi:hypothetical protein